MYKTLLIDWLTYVQNILEPSFVEPFDVVGPFAYNMPMPDHNIRSMCIKPRSHNARHRAAPQVGAFKQTYANVC